MERHEKLRASALEAAAVFDEQARKMRNITELAELGGAGVPVGLLEHNLEQIAISIALLQRDIGRMIVDYAGQRDGEPVCDAGGPVTGQPDVPKYVFFGTKVGGDVTCASMADVDREVEQRGRVLEQADREAISGLLRDWGRVRLVWTVFS